MDQSKMSFEAFSSRFIPKIIELLDIDMRLAKDTADAAYFMWDGIGTPEEAAEEEASYWGD